jgi:hypothetical protein
MAFLAICVLACACASPPLPSLIPAGAQLAIGNGTTIPVSLVVNGTTVGTVSPSSREDPVVASLPPLPWTVEARSPSNRVLLTLTVGAGDVASGAGGGVAGTQGRLASVDLSCGRLELWSGPAPVGEPTFIPGPSGDCQ